MGELVLCNIFFLPRDWILYLCRFAGSKCCFYLILFAVFFLAREFSPRLPIYWRVVICFFTSAMTFSKRTLIFSHALAYHSLIF